MKIREVRPMGENWSFDTAEWAYSIEPGKVVGGYNYYVHVYHFGKKVASGSSETRWTGRLEARSLVRAYYRGLGREGERGRIKVDW